MLPDTLPRWARALGTLGIIVGAGLIATTAFIHLHLWLTGHVARIGPLFLAQGFAGLVLGIALALRRSLGLVAAGAGYMAASAAGLLLSATIGFLGIHDGLDVPWAAVSLWVEVAGFILLAGVGALFIPRR